MGVLYTSSTQALGQSMWRLAAGLVMIVIRDIIDKVKSLQVRVGCDGYLGR